MTLAERVTTLIDFFYVKPFAKIVSRQIFRYGVCGGGNLALNWLLYFVFYHHVVCERFVSLGFITVSPHIATFILTFPITFFTGFWLQSHISFQCSPLKKKTQLFRYALSVAGSIIINYLCLKLFVEMMNVYPTPSQMISSLITVIYSYLVQKHFTFRGCR